MNTDKRQINQIKCIAIVIGTVLALLAGLTLFANHANADETASLEADSSKCQVMYRLYNKWTGEHFYTADKDEQANLQKIGWSYEGTGWYAPTSSKTPVYRLYNKHTAGGDHHYTMDKSEYDKLVKLGWTGEGIGWYSDDNKEVPVLRQYNPNEPANNHNFTTNSAENDELVKAGWKAEGTAWYGVKVSSSDDTSDSTEEEIKNEHEYVFAVYCEDDESLSFYNRDSKPTVGSTFNGKKVTSVSDINYKKILKSRYYKPGIFNYNFDISKIKKVTFVDKFQIGTCSDMFNGFYDLEVIENIENLDTSRVYQMDGMFLECYNIKELDLNSLNTSKVIDTECMFYSCHGLQSLKISNWNVSSLYDVYGMFSNCWHLQSLDLSKWNWPTIGSGSLDNMFMDCWHLTTIGDVSNWNVSKMSSFECTFYSCSNLKVDCSKWKVKQGVSHKWFCTKSPGVIEPNWTD